MFIVRIHENIDIVVDECHHFLYITSMPFNSEDPWGLFASFSNLHCYKAQSGLATQDFSCNFYVRYCIFKGYAYTYGYVFCLDEREGYPTKMGPSYGCF